MLGWAEAQQSKQERRPREEKKSVDIYCFVVCCCNIFSSSSSSFPPSFLFLFQLECRPPAIGPSYQKKKKCQGTMARWDEKNLAVSNRRVHHSIIGISLQINSILFLLVSVFSFFLLYIAEQTIAGRIVMLPGFIK